MMVMEPDPILDCKGAIALDNVFCDSMLPPDQDGQQMVLAMAYVPWQHLQTVYEPEYGLDRGTIFPVPGGRLLQWINEPCACGA